MGLRSMNVERVASFKPQICLEVLQGQGRKCKVNLFAADGTAKVMATSHKKVQPWASGGWVLSWERWSTNGNRVVRLAI
jgi:hypothetical protein